MISKLNSIYIEGKLLNLFTSYPYNRTQKAVIDGVKSNITNTSAGLPQWSQLGPLLFIIYINDISDIGLKCKILLFADDCTLLISDVGANKTLTVLNSDLNKLSTGHPSEKSNLIPVK